MKKIILTLGAALMVASSVMAQVPLPPVRVNEADLKKKMERSDADIADPKKNTKYRTWFDRGELYFKVGMVGSEELYRGMTRKVVEERYDIRTAPAAQKKTAGSSEFDAYKYPYFEAYYNDEDKLTLWEPLVVVDAAAFSKAYDAYAKAYDLGLNMTQTEAMKTSMNRLGTAVKQEAINNQNLDKKEAAADAFMLAGKVLAHPLVAQPDTASMYNAGRLYLMAEKYDKAVDALKLIADMGYYDEGNVYYYIYHAYQSKEDFESAKAILMEGVKKFPSNEKLTSSLAVLFASGKVEGDMTEVIALVEKAISDEPKNTFLLSGLGDMYNQNGQPDKAYEVYKRIVEITPDNFAAWAIIGNTEFNMAYESYVKFRENARSITSKTEYEAGKQAVLKEFFKSVESLEKAYSIDPNNRDAKSVVSLLKDATFLLRDDFPEMAEKNKKYTDLHNTMP